MGKGYNNYMCKKPFHPGSKANIKRAWMAEQKTENEKRKQDELKTQYEKEQDLYKNRALISSESKDKLELNFMYEAPPGAKRERQKEDDEPEYKFEWQRKYNAPREDYAKGNADIKDQPFGIPVRNVRCIKCHKWGHINTDKECPLYSQASTSCMPTTSMDPMELMRQMREDGYGLKENVLGHHLNPKAANQQLIPSDESDPEAEFLKSLSTAEKKKLLRKLKKLSKKQEKLARKKKKSKKTKKSKSKDSSESDSEDIKKPKKKKQKECSNSSSESSSSDEEDRDHVSKQKPHDINPSSKDKMKKKYFKSSVNDSDNESVTYSRESKKPEPSASEYSKDSSKLRKQKKDLKLRSDFKQEAHHKEKSGAKVINQKLPNVEENRGDIKINWKLNYSLSSTEDEQSMVVNQKPPKDKKKHKVEASTSEKSLKRTKTVQLGAEDTKIDGDNADHPDGFSHACPQAIIKAKYVQGEGEYEGKRHDRFRDLHRDDRSPSVKQKYNK